MDAFPGRSTVGRVNALKEWLLDAGIPVEAVSPAMLATGIALIAGLACVANLIAKKVIIRALYALIQRSQVETLQLLQEHKLFTRLSHIAPAIVIQALSPILLGEWPSLIEFARTGVVVYLIGVGLLVVDAALNVLLSTYNRLEKGKQMPIKGIVQAFKLVALLVGLVFMTAVILGKSPLILMSGLGALTAVLLLVFKDAILGFVAGIQLSVNNMVQTGDWIQMPKQGADGDIVDVSLTTVKVQNFDRTITTIPSYLLISDSFKNWRGMVEAGGRRIKRSIHIDMRTIRFLDAELLERCKKINLLRPYLDQALEEIQKHNSEAKLEMNDLLNGRNLTNIGTFRAYCVAYLRQHPKAHPDMTQLVRQLEPTAHGLPLEVYLFTNDIKWANYEKIQSDIFDHLLAIIPHFGLRVFQKPSGSDVADIGSILATAKDTSETSSRETSPGPVGSRN